MAKNKPNSIDVAVGARIRLARMEAGLSQTDIADALGMSFQQVQKYEKGTNRIAPSRLTPIAKMTGKPISWFYSEQDQGANPEADLVSRMLTAPHGIEIAKSFLAIKSNDHRVTVARMVAAIAA